MFKVQEVWLVHKFGLNIWIILISPRLFSVWHACWILLCWCGWPRRLKGPRRWQLQPSHPPSSRSCRRLTRTGFCCCRRRQLNIIRLLRYLWFILPVFRIRIRIKPYTEKIKKKKIGICSSLGRIRIQNRTRIRIHYPGSGSSDPVPDPYQNDTDPKHCILQCVRILFWRALYGIFLRCDASDYFLIF